MVDIYRLDKQKLSLPLQLLLRILAVDKNDAWTEQAGLFADMDWDAFIKLARHHRVHPYLYTKLKEIGSGYVPAPVLRGFYQEYCNNTFIMLGLSGEMERICQVFEGIGIRSLFLKGPVLAVDLYGDISHRTSCDLDILIPIKDLFRAEKKLEELGYRKDDYIDSVLNDWKWRHHHTTFIHPRTGIKVELHWRLNPAPSKEPGFEQLWSRRRLSPVSSHPLFYLGKEDLFLFLVTHGARHGWSRLRWLLDIKQILVQSPDPVMLKRLLKANRTTHIGGQALVLASQLLDVWPQPALLPLMAGNRPGKLAEEAMFYISRMVQLHTLPLPEEVERYHKRHLFSLMTVQQRGLFMLSFLFPYPEDAKTLPLPKTLHFLYLPLRPFLWAWRKLQGERHEKGIDRLL
ncbi:nucleotidyltransferase domain-containing protein [Paenibacillus nasutitermitis]|uniref:Renal dipeptidase n=1 Tax=Paenibacillus nasutitermitis TaxID=1652958 RepID=A0A916Z276_9BACL|nr:nucleotidyltransferase family protein [Paenibacillus nasutitermitis]GGD73297.1 hypothetical protein GCM10010911_33950 [Paenibacillus nasutitermitis]